MNLLDFIMNLFRSNDAAAAFVADPDEAMRVAGVPPASAAQFQAVAATAAPAGVALGGGDPVVGLQRAVADHHNFASPFSPVTTIAPQTNTELASRNNTEAFSGNEFASPDQAAGANAQNGAVNLGFGDITLGDKTTNTATDGAVVNTGTADDIDTTNVKGDGNVVGNEDTNANTGDVKAGDGSNVNIGEDNETDDDGVLVKDVDTSGGAGGGAGAGGGLLGGGDADGGDGGAGGGIIINPAPEPEEEAEVPAAQLPAQPAPVPAQEQPEDQAPRPEDPGPTQEEQNQAALEAQADAIVNPPQIDLPGI
jgi:hypothetical protein